MFLKLKKYLKNHPTTVTILGFVTLALLGAIFFFIRYPSAYLSSNFFAEDGRYFMKYLLEKGFWGAALTGFNGYLIVGQYIIGEAGIIINSIFGHGFITLAKAVAVASYLFFGLICALPYLLFRKMLGIPLSLITIFLLWITPLGMYDYFVIGSIGNLKFAFIFIATLLIIYRNSKGLCNKWWQFVLIDSVLLLCVLTNIIAVGLLPLLLIRYWDEIKQLFIKKKVQQFRSAGFLSLIVLAAISFVYLLVVYFKGVPTIEGYFDGPLHKSSFIALIYSSTIHALLFPITYLFNNVFAAIAVLLTLVYLFWRKENRTVTITIVVAILLSIFGFVLNRPGVTEVYLTYNQGQWTSNFFYAGTMLTVFGLCYASKGYFRKLTLFSKWLWVGLCGLLIIIFIPAAGFHLANPYTSAQAYRPTLAQEVKRVCSETTNRNTPVTIQVYPWSGWTMDIEKSNVCD